MALNGVIQTTERDEFVYHEMLTHVPILAHGHARKVLIIGGGDGGMLREVVKHRQLTDITMVEIDGAVVEMCREYLPHHSAGAFDDPRVRLVIADGLAFVRECQQQFDVIISDCTDPCGPGEVLFSSEFYQNCKRCLTANGIFVAQMVCHLCNWMKYKIPCGASVHMCKTVGFIRQLCPLMLVAVWCLLGPQMIRTPANYLWRCCRSVFNGRQSALVTTHQQCIRRVLPCLLMLNKRWRQR